MGRGGGTPPSLPLFEFPVAFAYAHAKMATALSPPLVQPVPNVQALTDHLLLQRYSPAAVLTTGKGDILYFSGKTGKYLELPAGEPNLNLFAMAREGLSVALNEAFYKAVRQKTEVTVLNVRLGTNGGTQIVDVTVQWLAEPEPLRGMVLIVFKDAATPLVPKASGKAERVSVHGARLAELSQELRHSRDELQTTNEKMQTAQEELRSANEEFQSTNEELQSTNEELTTSKEEMQSMNEELHTVNHELQAKVDELSRASDDMKNLLNSTNIATLFLDGELKVRRFTNPTTSIIKLIVGDAGRPITDIVSELDYPGLADDAREVLGSLTFHERQVSARDVRWFTVRIMPYRTQDNRIDGVVITFVEITVAKTMEVALHEALSVLQSRFTDQAAELDAAKTLERVLQKAQAVLEKHLADQTAELRQSRADLHKEKERKT